VNLEDLDLMVLTYCWWWIKGIKTMIWVVGDQALRKCPIFSSVSLALFYNTVLVWIVWSFRWMISSAAMN